MGGFARGLSSAGTSLKTSAKDKLKQVQIAGNQARNQIVDKATTGIDQVKETVDKHTYSLGKDETISSKGGTVAGFDEAEGMAKKDAQEDADARFVELKDLLVRKDAKGGPRLREGTLDLFNKITPRLAGGGVLKSWGSKEVLPGITLAKALKSSFANLNTHSGAYLVDMLTHDGIPSPAMQILDAMGYVTVEQVDVKNGASVIAGICSRMTPDEAKATFATLKRRGVPVGEIPYEVKVVADVATDTANAKSGDARAVNRWARNWDGRLAEGVLAIHERNESHGMTKDGINAFSKKKKQRNIVEEVRTQVARMIASETELGLEGEARMRLETKHPRFERALKRCRYIDDQLRARLIASVSQRDDEGLTSPVTEEEPSEFETAQEKDERHQGKLREDGQNLASVGVARSMLGDGGFGDAMRKGGLVKFIASMTPDARMMLVASQLPKEKRPLYLNPSTKASELAKLFTEAWEGGLRQSVYDSLFTATKKGEIEKDKAKAKNEGEKSNIANLQKDLVRVRSMLQLGGDAGPNYMALVDLSQDLTGTKVSTTTYGTRIWEIALRMKGAELHQIRSDPSLLLRLRKLVKNDKTKPSKTNWDKTVELLDLPATLKLKGADKENPATLENTTIEQKDADGNLLGDDATLSKAYQATSDNIEFRPIYWKMQLHRHVKMLHPSLSDTYSVVARAQQAAKRWVKHESAKQDRTGPAPTEAAFMRKIYDLMDPKDQKSVQEKVPHAYEALANGVHLTVDTRLERAKGWELFGSQTSVNASKGGIIGSFEDLTGRELLDEWSNVGELKDLAEKRKALQADIDKLDPSTQQDEKSQLEGEMKALQDQMASFWPSINRQKLTYIENNLAGATRTDILGMLAGKLAGAMRGDPEFKDAAKDAGLEADDYDAERLMFGHMMNKRRQLDSGSQMGSQSQIAALRSIKEMAYNPMAMGSFAKKGGNKDINKASSQSRKAQSNMYLAQVRNTESQLQQVRGDTTLTPEQRTEKAKHLREVSSEKIEESREELDKRNAAFTKARSQITKAISKIVQALFVVAVTAATAGQGTVAVIVSMILASIAREAGKSITKWAMEGDAYEHKDLAKAIVIGAVKGALRAATMELLLVIDAASTVVDFTPEGMAGFAEQSNYGELVKHAAIEASLRSAVTDIPMNTVKYMLTVDRPFRDFGRNLDVFVATNAVSVIGRQAASIVGSIASQGGKDVEKLFGPSGGGTSPSGGVLSDAQQTFEQQGKAQVGALVGRLAIVGKKVKTVLAKIAKKVWGTYPERWRQLSNDSLAAIGIQAEEEMDASSLPSAAEVDRLVALIDQIADGTLRPEDLSAKDKKGIGRMIVYARQQGVDLP